MTTKPVGELTDDELIREHQWRFRAWMDRRRQFGELGAVEDRRLAELGIEGVRRRIPESLLVPEDEQA